MLRFGSLPFARKWWIAHPAIVLSALTFWLALLPQAYGQDFAVTASSFQPYAVDEGGSTLSTITVTGTNGFTGTVALACTITKNGVTPTQNPPTCVISPSSVAPPGSASLTFSAGSGLGSTGAYVVTVVGSSGGVSSPPQSLNISVLSVVPTFTVTVERPLVPPSVSTGTGAGATTTIDINPVNGYSISGSGAGVWLSCATVSPLVIYPPICTFSPQPAAVAGVAATPVTLTITAQPIFSSTTRNEAPSRRYYALWLPIPMLAFAGIGAASNRRSRKAWGLLALFVVAGCFLLTPACGNTTTGSTTPQTSIQTPKNTYTFTLMGVDTNGNVSTNTGSTTTSPTVSLAVN